MPSGPAWKVVLSTHTWQAVERAGTAVSRTLNSKLQNVACMLRGCTCCQNLRRKLINFLIFIRPRDLIQIFCWQQKRRSTRPSTGWLLATAVFWFCRRQPRACQRWGYGFAAWLLADVELHLTVGWRMRMFPEMVLQTTHQSIQWSGEYVCI